MWSLPVYGSFGVLAVRQYTAVDGMRDDLATMPQGRYVEIGTGIHGVAVSRGLRAFHRELSEANGAVPGHAPYRVDHLRSLRTA